MSVSTRTRFEIFKRDGFRCVPEFGFDDLRRAIQIANGYVHLTTLRRWKIFHGVIRRWRTTGERTA